jgi:hypothetical protein
MAAVDGDGETESSSHAMHMRLASMAIGQAALAYDNILSLKLWMSWSQAARASTTFIAPMAACG